MNSVIVISLIFFSHSSQCQGSISIGIFCFTDHILPKGGMCEVGQGNLGKGVTALSCHRRLEQKGY